jgi:Lysozyme like domain
VQLCMNEAMFCLKAAGFSGIDLETGGAVGMAESSLETDRIGRLPGADGIFDNEDLGWMQISTKWHEAKVVNLVGQNWRDPFANAVLARQAWEEFARQGKDPWSAWAAYNSRAHVRYLPLAKNAASGLWAPSPDGSQLLANRRLAS